MRVAVTGTPGTGKTTAVERVERAGIDLEPVHLNAVIEREGFDAGTDAERGSIVVDMDAVGAWLDGRGDVLVESHLAHRFAADRVIVLRCHPEELTQRLTDRDEDATTMEENATSSEMPCALTREARENAEAETLDVVLSEAVAEHGRESVYEIDTTARDPEWVADEIRAVVAGEREPSAGTVDFTDYL